MSYTDESFFEVIGHISVFFATWDVLTSLLILRLVKRQSPLPNLDRKTLGQKLQLLMSLTPNDVIDATVLDRVQAAISDALPVAEKRNRFIHDQWMFSPETVPLGEIILLSVEVMMGVAGRTITMVPTKFHITDLREFLGTVGRQQAVFHALLGLLPVSN